MKRCLVPLLLVVLSAVAIACRNDGGDSASKDGGAATAVDGIPTGADEPETPAGGELTLEEFFQQVKAALDRQRAATFAVGAAPDIDDDETLDATEKASLLANLDGHIEVLNELHDTLRRLAAPDEVAGAAADLVSAAGAQAAFWESTRPRLESAASPADLEARGRELFTDWEEARAILGGVSSACSALQAIGDEHEVGVALPC